MATADSTAPKIYTKDDRLELLNTIFELDSLLEGVKAILYSIEASDLDTTSLANSANNLLNIARERVNSVMGAIDEKIPTTELA